MSISFGSTSIKPYVGSKEVKEAYVGSALVYQGVPPVVYAFQGDASTYTIAPWCELTKDAIIAKNGDTYCIALYNSNTGRGYITLTKVYHKYLKFGSKRTDEASITANVIFYRNGEVADNKPFQGYASYFQQYSFAIPEGCDKIVIQSDATMNNVHLITNYLENIRYEQA